MIFFTSKYKSNFWIQFKMRYLDGFLIFFNETPSVNITLRSLNITILKNRQIFTMQFSSFLLKRIAIFMKLRNFELCTKMQFLRRRTFLTYGAYSRARLWAQAIKILNKLPLDWSLKKYQKFVTLEVTQMDLTWYGRSKIFLLKIGNQHGNYTRGKYLSITPNSHGGKCGQRYKRWIPGYHTFLKNTNRFSATHFSITKYKGGTSLPTPCNFIKFWNWRVILGTDGVLAQNTWYLEKQKKFITMKELNPH